MFRCYLLVSILLPIILLNAQKNNEIRSDSSAGISTSFGNKTRVVDSIRKFFFFVDVHVVEHQPSNSIANDSDIRPSSNSTEKTLIR